MQRTSVIQPTTSSIGTFVPRDDNMNESAPWIVFRKMLFFIILMAVAPLGSFFIAKDYLFEGLLNISNRYSYTYSAVVAVIVVHIVLISFLIVAFKENIPTKKSSIDTTNELTRKTD